MYLCPGSLYILAQNAPKTCHPRVPLHHVLNLAGSRYAYEHGERGKNGDPEIDFIEISTAPNEARTSGEQMSEANASNHAILSNLSMFCVAYLA